MIRERHRILQNNASTPFPLSPIHSFYFFNQFLFIHLILFFFLLLLINNFLFPNFFHFKLIVEYHPLSMFPVHLCVRNIISYSNVTLYLSWSSLADIESILNKIKHCIVLLLLFLCCICCFYRPVVILLLICC